MIDWNMTLIGGTLLIVCIVLFYLWLRAENKIKRLAQ